MISGLLSGLLMPKQPTPSVGSGGMLSPNIDWQSLMDLGTGIMAASGPSLSPVSTGQALAQGRKFQAEMSDNRINNLYKQAMAQKAVQGDFEDNAQRVLVKKTQGLELSPEEEATLKAWDMTRTSQMGMRFDEAGNPVYAPKYNSVLNAPSSAPVPQPATVSAPPPVEPVPTQTPAPATNFGTEPQITKPSSGLAIPIINDRIDANESLDMSGLNTLPAQPPVPVSSLDKLNLPPEVMSNPRARQAAIEKSAEMSVEQQAKEQKAQKAWMGSRDKWKYAIDTADVALERLQNPWVGGTVGTIAGMLPSSAKASYDRDVSEIKAKLAIQEIKDMREADATFGQVTEKEWPKIESGYGMMDSADPEQAARGLKAVKEGLTKMFTYNDLIASGVDKQTAVAVYEGDKYAAAQAAVTTGKPVTMSINGEIVTVEPEVAVKVLERRRRDSR